MVVSPKVTIGNNVKIQNNVSLYTGVILEDDVFCGPSMVFTNVVNPRSHVSRKDEYRETLVKQGASLGANCTIVCGHTIGRYAFIGAGAVVTRDVPDYALVVGNPGRISGWMCQCGVKLAAGAQPPAQAQCRACGTKYRAASGVLAARMSEVGDSRPGPAQGLSLVQRPGLPLSRHVRPAWRPARRVHGACRARRRVARDHARREGRLHRPQRRRQEHAAEARHRR